MQHEEDIKFTGPITGFVYGKIIRFWIRGKIGRIYHMKEIFENLMIIMKKSQIIISS